MSRRKKPSVCFFAKVASPEVLRRVEFYRQDVDILNDLGFEVRIATRVRDLVRADLYFVWWWTWAFAPVTVARLLRRPSIVTGTFDAHTFDARRRMHKWLIGHALRRASANVFLSALEHEQVPRILPVNNPCHVPLIIDTAVYSPNAVEREDLVFTVSWLEPMNVRRKCIAEIVRAVPLVRRENPQTRFVIAGEHGAGYPELAELARAAGASDCISFPGAISPAEKIDLLRRCKVYLQPSRHEGFGLAILEAMGCAAPVVTSPVGAVPEVVGDAALLVDGTAPEAIAAGVNHLLARPDVRRDLGARARVRAETLFSYERRKAALKQIIEQVSAENNPSPHPHARSGLGE